MTEPVVSIYQPVVRWRMAALVLEQHPDLAPPGPAFGPAAGRWTADMGCGHSKTIQPGGWELPVQVTCDQCAAIAREALAVARAKGVRPSG